MSRPAAATAAVDLWKRRVPRHYQQMVIEARLGGRQLVDPHRRLPDFLVIGAQRAGTSSVYKWLEAHPNVVASLRKETEYLTARWCQGEAWYRGHFPSRVRRNAEWVLRHRRIVSFEASPNYLFHPLAPKRAVNLVPGARLVALLRNPVDRAYSHYQHEVRAGRESRSFQDALDGEEALLAGQEERMTFDPCYRSLDWEQKSYVARGRYAEQLEGWIDCFGRDRLLVINSEHLYRDTGTAYRTILDHLDLPVWAPASFANHSYVSGATRGEAASQLTAALRRRLVEEFAPSNRRLYELLGQEFDWES